MSFPSRSYNAGSLREGLSLSSAILILRFHPRHRRSHRTAARWCV